jgi:hypothetical protein
LGGKGEGDNADWSQTKREMSDRGLLPPNSSVITTTTTTTTSCGVAQYPTTSALRKEMSIEGKDKGKR